MKINAQAEQTTGSTAPCSLTMKNRPVSSEAAKATRTRMGCHETHHASPSAEPQRTGNNTGGKQAISLEFPWVMPSQPEGKETPHSRAARPGHHTSSQKEWVVKCKPALCGGLGPEHRIFKQGKRVLVWLEVTCTIGQEIGRQHCLSRPISKLRMRLITSIMMHGVHVMLKIRGEELFISATASAGMGS